MLRKLKIRLRLIVGFGIPLLFMVVVGCIGLQSVNKAKKQTKNMSALLIATIDELNGKPIDSASQLLKGIREKAHTASTEADKTEESATKAIIVFLLIGSVVGVWIAFTIGRSILAPVEGLVKIADMLVAGDFSGTIVTGESKDEMNSLAIAIGALRDHLRGTVSKMKEITERIARYSEELSNSFLKVEGETRKEFDEIVRVSASTEEVSATFAEIAAGCTEASRSAREMSSSAVKGRDVVDRNLEGMKSILGIVNASEEVHTSLLTGAGSIGEIVSVIGDIADQTNLLALNAAIEAARAGDQGRGFAVVADEVRKLAEKTIKATKEIDNMMNGIQKNTADAVQSMENIAKEIIKGEKLSGDAGAELRNIVTTVQSTTDMVDNIATATEEQSLVIKGVASTIEDVRVMTQKRSSVVDDTMHLLAELKNEALGLMRMVDGFSMKT